ncbi:MAG: ComEC/Rec2 family competence protein [Cyanobacteria bacterium REEB67]|nr:ComEC/Rec2 family competence protein [Cyanobacteria bacterium REEB67]
MLSIYSGNARPSAADSTLAGAQESAQLFVCSSLVAASGALLALLGLPWVFGLAMAMIIALAAPLFGGGKRGAFLLAAAFSLAFGLASNRLAGLIAGRDDLSRSRADFVAFEGNVQSSKFKDTDQGRFFTMEVACLRQLTPRAKALGGRVLIHAGPYRLSDRLSAPLWGRTYIFRGRLSRPHPKLFSFEFDEQRWLSLKGIYCQISCQPPSIIAQAPAQAGSSSEAARPSAICTFFAAVAELRDEIVRAHCLAIGDERGRVLASMVLGDRAVSLSDSLRASFNRVGLSHLLAASGLNLTIIVGAALFILAGFSKKNRQANIGQTLGAFVCVLFFVSLAGASPSVTRATIMCLLLLWSGLLFRRLATGAALAFALWLSILLDPLSLLDVGLELSYGATFGIIYFVPIFTAAQPFFCARRPWSWLSSLTAVVFAAQFAVLPVQIFYFQKLSTLVLPANIFAEPLVAPITVSGFISSLLFALVFFCRASTLPVFPFISAIALQCANCIDRLCAFLIDLLLLLTNFLGSCPLAYIHLSRPTTADIVVYYLTLLLAFLIGPQHPRRAALLLTAAAAILTLQSLINSSFIEVLQGRGQLVVFAPWSGVRLYVTRSTTSTSSITSPSDASFSLSRPLAAYRRNFAALYLRSLAGRGFPTAVDCQAAAHGTLLFSRRLQPGGPVLSLLSLGSRDALLSPWPAAACEYECVQDVRLIRLKVWGLLCLYLDLDKFSRLERELAPLPVHSIEPSMSGY